MLGTSNLGPRQNAVSETTATIDPEWITVSQACRYASVSKPLLYTWINAGKVRSFSHRKRHQIKGKRLIYLESLRCFLLNNSTGGEAMETDD
jgi:hypothetical protein